MSVIPLYILFFCLVLITIVTTVTTLDTVPSVSAFSIIFPINTGMNTSNYTSNNNYLEQVNRNYESSQLNNWSLGNNITEGDYYEYKICNDSTISQIIYPYHCYTINLEFVTILESYTGKVWVVQGNFTILDSTLGTIDDTIDDTTESMIFLIDTDTFTVYTRFHKELGASIQNTIFSLSQYGEKSLSIGTIWDEMDSYFTNKIPLEIKNKQTIQIPQKIRVVGVDGIVSPSIVTNIDTSIVTNIDVNIETSVLSYDVIVPSNTYLHPDFPFPLKAVLYSPNIIYPTPQELYYFELLEYSNYYSREFEKSGVSIIPTSPTEDWEYSN